MNTFRRRTDGVVISQAELIAMYPNYCFPSVIPKAVVDRFGYDPVLTSPPPVPDTSHLVVASAPVQEKDTNDKWTGNWVQGWKLVPIPAEQLIQMQAESEQLFIKSIRDVVQKNLDAFAHTRLYGFDDGSNAMMSACSYTTSTNPKFRVEGEYCVKLRDDTWAALYKHLADVNAGTIPKPSTIAEVIAILPVPKWPDESPTSTIDSPLSVAPTQSV